MINKRLALVFSIIVMVFSFMSCSNKNKNEENSIEEKIGENVNLSNEDYVTYLNNKYNEYLDNLDVDTKYALDKANVTAEDYIDNLKEAYRQLSNKLLSLKNDLQDGVKTKSEKIKGINDNIINSVDEAITTTEKVIIKLEYNGDEMKEKTQDEIKSELESIEEESNRAREKLAREVNNVKSKLMRE